MLKGSAFAHRGLHNKEVKENTIESFKRAIEAGYGIELDIRMTQDKYIVVLHDKNLKGMIGVNLNIEEVKYNELKRYDVPLLIDVINLLVESNTKVLLEIKTSPYLKEIMPKVYEIIKDVKLDLAIISFNPNIVKWFKKRGFFVGQSISTDIPSLLVNIVVRGWIKYSNPDFLVVEKNHLKYRGIKQARNKIKIVAWTIKDKSEIKKYENFCDNFIFDEF